MKKNIASLALSLPFLLATTACSTGDSEPTLTQPHYDDVAISVGSLVAHYRGSEALSVLMSMTITEGPDFPVTEPETFEPTDEPVWFVLFSQYLFTYGVTCRDADGVALYICGDTDESAKLTLTWTGSYDGGRYRVNVNRTGTWYITGLQSDTAKLEGDSVFDIEVHLQDLIWATKRDLLLSYDAAYQDLRIDNETYEIVGGTIRYSVDGIRTLHLPEGDYPVEFAMDVVVTFHDDRTADLVVAGDHYYTIDMETATITTEDGIVVDVTR